MINGQGPIGPRAFGDAGDIGVERGFAEFRAGRPLLIHAGDDTVAAMPIDGANADRIAAFQALCHPARPRLAVTARRARALGIDTAEPMLLDLDPADDAASVFALAAQANLARKLAASRAGPAPTAAIELAKLVHKLPALLVAPAESAFAHAFDPPLVTVA